MNIMSVLGILEAANQLYGELKSDGMASDLTEVEADIEDIIKTLQSAKAKSDFQQVEALGASFLQKIKGAVK